MSEKIAVSLELVKSMLVAIEAQLAAESKAKKSEPVKAVEAGSGDDSAEEWPQDVYTFHEAAARLRCSYHTIWRGVARGKIKACKYQTGRIPAAEVLRLVRGE